MLRHILVGVAISLAATLTVTSTAVAFVPVQDMAPRTVSTSASDECAADGTVPSEVAPAVAVRIKAKVLEAYRSGEITSQHAVPPRVLTEAPVLRTDDGLVVVVPLAGLEEPSNLTILVGHDGAVSTVTESHFVEATATSGRATIWVDGLQVLDREVHADRPQTAGGGMSTQDHGLGFFGALNQCLSSAGLASWLVAAALVACTATGPVGMAVCLVGAGVGVGTASYCVRWAITHG